MEKIKFLNEIYYNILNEEKLKNSKWKYFNTFQNIECYESLKHINNRIKIRYGIIQYKNIIYNQIINNIKNNFLNINFFYDKNIQTYLRSFTCNCIKSNIYLSGIIQNDNIDSKIRIYISTYQPNINPKINKHDYLILINI